MTDDTGSGQNLERAGLSANPLRDDDPVLPPWMAAPRIGLAPSTLAKWRMRGEGPAFIRLSATRVGYKLSAINTWLTDQQRRSTLEDKGHAA